MSKQTDSAEPDDIYELLPWFAAGNLPADEMARVSRAIANDPALAITLERIEEERTETILDNEARPMPPAASFDRLLARIESEAPRLDRSAAIGRSWTSRLFAGIANLAPRTVALAGVAAALVIVAAGGFLANAIIKQGGDTGAHYETASVNPANAEATSFLLVQFAGNASIAVISSYLRDKKATIVAGPLAGGLFRVNVAAADAEALLNDLKGRKDLVRFASPTK